MKWRDAAREAAYELWSIIRDLSTEGGEVRSNSSDAAGWGWEERDGRGTVGNDAEDEECGAQQENTLGVMLRKLLSSLGYSLPFTLLTSLTQLFSRTRYLGL